jgi:hypothetical protein
VSLGGTDVDVGVQPSAAGQLGEGRAGGAGWTRDPRLGGSLVMRVLTSLVRRSTWPGHMMRRATASILVVGWTAALPLVW